AQEQPEGQAAPKRRRRRRKPSVENGEQSVVDENHGPESDGPSAVAGSAERAGGEQQDADAGGELRPAGDAKPRTRRQGVAPDPGDENGKHDRERNATDVVAPDGERGPSGKLEPEHDGVAQRLHRLRRPAAASSRNPRTRSRPPMPAPARLPRMKPPPIQPMPWPKNTAPATSNAR